MRRRASLTVYGNHFREISIIGRVKRYFLVSPRQQANMQETPYSDRKAEELRRSRIMGVDNALRSNSSKYFDKSKEEFTTDNAFILPFAVFALFLLLLIAIPTVRNNQSRREEAIKVLENKYGTQTGHISPAEGGTKS